MRERTKLRYTRKEFMELRDLLKNPSEHAHWSAAIAVLGMTGDPDAFNILVNFLERDAGSISHEVYATKLDTLITLGYLLHKTHNPNILTYMKKGLHPSSWSSKIKWKGPVNDDGAARNAHLATMTILGLALSGQVKALTALQNRLDELNMRKHVRSCSTCSRYNTRTAGSDNESSGKFEAGTVDVLKEAIQVNQHVSKDGLLKYYRESELKQLGFNTCSAVK